MTSAPKRTTDADFERELDLGRALLDLSAASACLSDFIEVMKSRSFDDLSYEVWCDEQLRLNWLAERIAEHVTAAHRIFYRKDVEQPSTGTDERA